MGGTRARDCGLMSRCRCYVLTRRHVFIYLPTWPDATSSNGFQALQHIQNNYTHTVHHSSKYLENIVPQQCKSRPVQPGPICWRWRSMRWSRMRMRRSWQRRRRCIPTWLRLDWGGADNNQMGVDRCPVTPSLLSLPLHPAPTDLEPRAQAQWMYFVFTRDIFTFYPQCCSYRAVESRGLISFISLGFDLFSLRMWCLKF